MDIGIAVAVFAFLAGITLLAMISMFRAAMQSKRLRTPEQVTPFIDYELPDPVVRTRGVTAESVIALLWGAAHLALAGTWFVVGGREWLPLVAPAGVAMAYVCVAALLTGAGGVMLYACKPYGRIVISWGGFLFAVLAFFGVAITLMLPGFEEVPRPLREGAGLLAAGIGAHLVLDTVIGTAARHVGKPAPEADVS